VQNIAVNPGDADPDELVNGALKVRPRDLEFARKLPPCAAVHQNASKPLQMLP
jgi:hypothetical protein